MLIFQNVPNSWANTPHSHQECNKVCQMTTVQAKAVVHQLGKPHMTMAQTFPHTSQTISQSAAGPRPAQRHDWGCMLNYSLCSVIRLTWLWLFGLSLPLLS